uniref:RING-type domain-containing protein n=1 Tax=Anser brachyrhynchus TaxID=132585 RepID=A0A8B9C004_9AVES
MGCDVTQQRWALTSRPLLLILGHRQNPSQPGLERQVRLWWSCAVGPSAAALGARPRSQCPCFPGPAWLRQPGPCEAPRQQRGSIMATEADVTCPVCQGTPEEPSPSVISPCQHQFCLGCILRWAKRSINCPLCRQDITSISLSKGQVTKEGRWHGFLY